MKLEDNEKLNFKVFRVKGNIAGGYRMLVILYSSKLSQLFDKSVKNTFICKFNSTLN